MSGVYFIAEIGQNHNGSYERCKELVDACIKAGVDAVKLTKRDLSEEMSNEMWEQPYVGTQSYGPTYGEHRQKLELSYEEHVSIRNYVKAHEGVDFIDTLCSPRTVDGLARFCDQIKVASRDLSNTPLLQKISETGRPVILSTGMADTRDLMEAMSLFPVDYPITILHCVSAYPTYERDANLKRIKQLQGIYHNLKVGYSDHTIGVLMPIVAYSLGATVIEKHVTLDKNDKGSDHKGSLEPHELELCVAMLRDVEKAMHGEYTPSPSNVKKKLCRSLGFARDMKTGELIWEHDLNMISPGDGLPWKERHKIIGRQVNCDVRKNDLCSLSKIH